MLTLLLISNKEAKAHAWKKFSRLGCMEESSVEPPAETVAPPANQMEPTAETVELTVKPSNLEKPGPPSRRQLAWM